MATLGREQDRPPLDRAELAEVCIKENDDVTLRQISKTVMLSILRPISPAARISLAISVSTNLANNRVRTINFRIGQVSSV